MRFSKTAKYDPEHIKINENVSLENLKKGLAGLADDSLTYNNETRRVEERATARENAPARGESVVGSQVSAESVNEAQRGEIEGESGTIRRLLPEESQNSSIKEQLRAHLDEVNKMSPVTKINYSPSNKLTLREKVGEIFKRFGYKVDRQGFGTIEIGEKQIRKSMNYLSTDGELAALLGVPHVLKRGIDISGHGNHKGRSFSTVTFAAPVEINDVVGNVAVVVQMVGKNNYHTHRILMPDGSEFVFNKKTDAEPRNAGVKGDEHRQGPAINSASNNSIPQNTQKSTVSGEKVSVEDNGSGRSAIPKTREAKARKKKRAQEHQKQQKAKKKAEGLAEMMREARENEPSGTPIPTDGEMRGRGYTDAEANAARGLVKDFDLLQPQARRAVIEMMRSGKATGASKTFMKHAANLIAYWRRDLWVICDDKIRDDGFFYVFDDGTRLITVKPGAEGRSINEALMHELGHDVWQRADAKTRKALYDLAVDGASKSDIEDIRKRYQDELSKRGDLEGLSETEVDALLDEEVAVNRLGEVLGKQEFLDRLAGGEVSVIKRLLRTLSVMKKRFTGKDRYLYRKADDLFRAFTRVMAWQSVTGMNGEKMHVSGGRHLLAIDNQGNKVVVMYEDVLKGATGSPHQIVANQIAAHIGEYYTIFESGQKVFIGEDLPGEYTQSKYTQNLLKRDLKTLKVKNKASQNFGEMIEIATNRRWEKAKHTTNKDAKYGFYRYTTKIAVPIFDNSGAVVNANIYKADLLIRNASDGRKYLYDITEIKKERSSSLPQSWITKIGKIVSTSTTNSISQNSKKSTTSAKKVSGNNGSGRRALPKEAGEDIIARAYERGMGVKSQTSAETKTETLKQKPKRKTNAEVRAEERARADKLVSAEKERIEREAAHGVNKASRTTARLNQQIQYLKNAVSHRKHTDGGNDAAHVLENSALKGFIKYFANRTAAYGATPRGRNERGVETDPIIQNAPVLFGIAQKRTQQGRASRAFTNIVDRFSYDKKVIRRPIFLCSKTDRLDQK